MKAFKEFKNGLTKQSAFGLISLLNKYTKKQKGLWITLGIFWAVALIASLSVLSNDWSSPLEILFMSKMIIIIGATIPILIITTFSVPSTLNSIHKSTMIKRIGATRLTEQSFVMVTWTYYFMLAIIVYVSCYMGFSIILGVFDVGNLITSLLYSIVLISMLTSMGVLLGTLPIGTAASTTISIVLFIVSLLFGGLLPYVTSAFAILMPNVTIILIMVNPIGLSTYVSYAIASGLAGTYFALLGTLYVLLLSSMMFFGSSMLMSFNKVR